MLLNEFVEKFAELFEDTDASEITPDCAFQELDEWDSLMGMTIISFVKTECGKTVSGGEVRQCRTPEELFHLVESK